MAEEHLVVQLEDAATRSALIGVIGLLAQVTQQWQFVGLVEGDVRYRSATFAAPYSWGHLPSGRTMLPGEAWAPGMAAALTDLRKQLAADGWAEATHGGQLWDTTYRRTRD